jgi:hypothetical protein
MVNIWPKTYLNRALVTNSLVSLAWWLIFNPGFYSGDSFAVIEMARSGNLNSDWGGIWAIFVSLITLGGDQPQIATLILSQILCFSVTIFCFTLTKEVIAQRVSTVMCATPLVGAMSISLWHDIPMTAGILLFFSGLTQVFSKGENRNSTINSRLLISAGIVLASFRYNGLPALLLFILALILFNRNNRQLYLILVAIVFVLGLTTILNLEMKSNANVQATGLTTWMEYDISCYLATESVEKVNQLNFDGRFSSAKWQSKSACRWFTTSQYFHSTSRVSSSEIVRAWSGILLADPGTLVKIHLIRHSYLFPILVPGMFEIPFIHTTIEIKNKNIDSTFPRLTDTFKAFPRSWNYLRPIFAFSGFWLLALLFIAYWRRNEQYLWCGVLGVILTASISVFAVIPDPRFVLFVLVSGQVIVLTELLILYETTTRPKFGVLRNSQRK